MIRRKIRKEMLQESPYALWNAFVDLLAKERYSDLDEVQRTAHLCFWYDSEVQNGGHLQCFENRGTGLLADTLVALRNIGAECQHKVLAAAWRLFSSRPRERIETRDEFVSVALSGEFEELDAAYYACQPPMQKLLEDYLHQHKDRFVEIT